jgi:uncharacterized alkaline shock family protein YloU
MTDPISEPNQEIEPHGGSYDAGGKTTIAPDVLLTIARLTTMDVPGVNRMGSIPPSGNRLFNRGAGNGVRIGVDGDTVSADLYVILNGGVNIRDVSRKIQSNVARAISEMVGMHIGRVNVHIENIDYTMETGI